MNIDIEVKTVVERITIELMPGEAAALSLAVNQHLGQIRDNVSWPWLTEFRDRLDNARVGSTNLDPLPAREPDRI